jgi:hypothetical protein
MKALVIDEPWMGLILSGKKTWEMRKRGCNIRGPIALIRKGSGQVVGVAQVVDSRPPIATKADFAAAERYHRIPPVRQAQAFTDGWATPWVLADAKTLARPVHYSHPSGAVIWVNLAPDVEHRIDAAMTSAKEAPPLQKLPRVPVRHAVASSPAVVARVAPKRTKGPSPDAAPVPSSAGERVVTVSGGNLRNGHFYLPLDFFPDDAIGGSNKALAAHRKISVNFMPGATVETDIDGSKRILRERGAVKDFFARNGIVEGQAIRLRRLGPYRYEVSAV